LEEDLPHIQGEQRKIKYSGERSPKGQCQRQSPLTTELNAKLNRQQELRLNGISRLPKAMVASALANHGGRDLFVVCATLEEAGRVHAQMEAMGWQTVHFYPTSEASPYEPFDRILDFRCKDFGLVMS
jgi:transcription-repair coupling factor (superfamily II helicase)